MGRPNPETDAEHLKNPQPGDYWEEHFCIYFAVLAVLPNGNIIAVDAIRQSDGQYLDEKLAYEMTPAEMEKQVKYSTGNGFVATVHPDSKAVHRLIEDWVKAGKPYRPWSPPPVVKEDPWLNPTWGIALPDQWEYHIGPENRARWTSLSVDARKILWENATQLTKKG